MELGNTHHRLPEHNSNTHREIRARSRWTLLQRRRWSNLLQRTAR